MWVLLSENEQKLYQLASPYLSEKLKMTEVYDTVTEKHIQLI